MLRKSTANENTSSKGGKYNHSFQTDEEGNNAIKEAMARGGYQRKADLFRDAVVLKNEQLKEQGAIA